jgi:hypothetical protein
MSRDRCGECGVELTLGPRAPCPLCGTEPPGPKLGSVDSLSESQRSRGTEANPGVADVDSYQSDVQRLREQLRRLRSGAEAV